MSSDNNFLKQVTNMLKKSKRCFEDAMRFSEAIKDPAVRQTAELQISEYRKDFNKT